MSTAPVEGEGGAEGVSSSSEVEGQVPSLRKEGGASGSTGRCRLRLRRKVGLRDEPSAPA